LNINDKNYFGNNPLLHAISNNNDDIISSLISYAQYKRITLRINEKNNNEYPLMLAIKKNNISMVESLINYGTRQGMSLNNIDKDGLYPVTLAYKLNYQNIYDFIYRKWGYTNKDLFLYHAIDNNDISKAVDLINSNASFNYIHSSGNSSLDLIISKGNNILLNYIIMNECITSSMLNRTNSYGMVPIVSVINSSTIKNKSKIIEEFIKLGANVNYIDTNGNSPLYCSSYSSINNILRKHNAVSIHNKTIDKIKFRSMVQSNELEKIKSMLGSNIKLNIPYQTEIVNYAIELKKTEIVRFLISKGFSHYDSQSINKKYNYSYNYNIHKYEYNSEGREINRILINSYNYGSY